MADRSPDPDLWMVTARARQPLKDKFCTFGRVSKAFTPCQLCDC